MASTIFRDRWDARNLTAGGNRTVWCRVLRKSDGTLFYGDPVPFRPLPGSGAYVVKVTPKQIERRRSRYLGLDRAS